MRKAVFCETGKSYAKEGDFGGRFGGILKEGTPIGATHCSTLYKERTLRHVVLLVRMLPFFLWLIAIFKPEERKYTASINIRNY
ncbi:hypothetical protein ABR27_07340 [Enterobacter hormaechei subsp. hormaechei]|nr:hypothetical protein ABR27_07340 [Enterobacter hormaechei subsp. hormaechei]